MQYRPSKYEDLTLFEKELLPTENEIIKYENTGWHITPKIISEEILNDALQGAQDFYDGKRDFTLRSLSGIADDHASDQKAIYNNEFTTLRKKELQQLGFHKVLVATAAALARSSQIRLFADSLITKKPSKEISKGNVGWHSDKAYWPTCTSDHMLTAWIPLQDVTIDMGPLMHIDYSHEWKEEAQLKSFYSFNNQDLGKFAAYLEKEKPNHSKSYMTIKKGQVSFHNCHTIHSSFPNTSNLDRVALAVHFQDHRNRYQVVKDDDGKSISIGYDRICAKDENGNPDYADSQIFPLLFENTSI